MLDKLWLISIVRNTLEWSFKRLTFLKSFYTFLVVLSVKLTHRPDTHTHSEDMQAVFTKSSVCLSISPRGSTAYSVGSEKMPTNTD